MFLRLSLAILGAGTLLLGAILLVRPSLALSQLGIADPGDAASFLASLLGSVMVPWGAGVLAISRSSRITRFWLALALVNCVAALVVLIYSWGAETLQFDKVWPLILVYGLALLGIASFGQRELRSAAELPMDPQGADYTSPQ